MCVIVQYLCPKCKKETGQRDYVSHTDGQRFAIPDPNSVAKLAVFSLPAMKPGLHHATALVAGGQQRLCHFISGSSEPRPYARMLIWDDVVEVVSFCPDIRTHRAVIHAPWLQSPDFRCMSPSCSGFKINFDAKKCRIQNANILRKLRDTEYSVTIEGNGVMDVKTMLGREGIRKTDMHKLPGAKLQKWTLYTEDKLKKMTAKGDSYEDIKTALRAITGLSYTTYQIIAKAASFKLHDSLFPSDRAKHVKTWWATSM